VPELTNKQRNKLPSSSFGLPKDKKYPMPDRAHAANAKSRAQQQYDKGNLSKAELDKIDRKANGILHKKKSTGLIGVKKRKRGLLITDHGDVDN
jgi:hypothetical protein